MGFLSVCTALYDYQPQNEGELEIIEGELLYILEKSTEDDWWRAKKKAVGDEDDEPEGLIPNNYVAEAKPSHSAKALYDYSRQTDEEISFSEDTALDVYDTSDPDWTLVGLNGEFGFAPAIYIEISSSAARSPTVASPRQSITTPPEPAVSTPNSPTRSNQSPAANLARVLGGGTPSPAATRAISSPSQQQLTPDASDGEAEEPAPALPRRPPSQTISSPTTQHAIHREDDPPGISPSPPYNRAIARSEGDNAPVRSSGGFRLYNVNEMVSTMGRRKKMPTTLGLNIATGTIMLSPERSRDGPAQEWTAEKLTHYSLEDKHVFIDLVRPSKNLDLHAGAKDTAEEIVAMLGDIAGAVRAEGIKEVIAAASGGGVQKKGLVQYDFVAQGDDEVTVAVGDEVIILDDTKSEDWWNVRRLKDGNEGVMPSSYIEITGTIATEPPSRSGLNAGRSTVEQNRIEEERLAKEAARASRTGQEAESAKSRSEVGPRMQLPQRGSSLADEDARKSSRRDKRTSRSDGKSRSKPDPTKTRTWTDHSGSFKVEAQFIGIADGKIHLHKVNGVKIAVPVTKMSPTDLAYVEKATNESMEEHMPVADLIKMKRKTHDDESSRTRAGASVGPSKPDQPKIPEYDWFDFFLKAGVGPHQCERYGQAMVRDSMDESVLPDITQETLRTLGLKEGDSLKVMKYLDQKFGRSRAPPNVVNGDGAVGGIFSGPGGALHNNTSRSRPDANRQTSDVVDPNAFNRNEKMSADAKETPLTKVPAPEPKGFDDDAWTIQPSKQVTAPQRTAATPPPPKPPTGALADLSLLDKPLEPTPAQPPKPAVQPQPTPAPTQQAQQGANPSFFSQLGQERSGIQPQNTGFQQMPQLNLPRQRPQAPQQSFVGAGLLSPPPRPTSAPQNPQHNQFGLQPLQPQLTGIPSTSALQAPLGQSLDELTRQKMQQQYNQFQLQQQPTGFQSQSFTQYPNGLAPQPTGFPPQHFQHLQQPFLNGNASGSPFADPRPPFQPQSTAFGSFAANPPAAGINSVLPPALQPQKTGFTPQPQQNGFGQGFQPQPTGFQSQPLQPMPTGYQQPFQSQPTGFGQPLQNGFGTFQPPPVPPVPQQQTAAPLQPQKTGPAPNVKFGVTEAKKLTPQPTGRRANLASATPQNPFGF